ncbi:Mitochondrial import inner membrane translocase subunit Tim21 [Pseudolycoriella hygida]|uniref:Mitochondrial import inner membrane translocase subunit Tim21 n=1 Tax=Pseudolycoriella hygida TaxID=35572 RepID=A0A9Q0N9P3_9DIPT|nr:Mitochondrial import inner membrane translocase subunit Tim21 [Pseudolycoriella hygida]
MFLPRIQQQIKSLFFITRPQLRRYAERKSGALATAQERTNVSTDVKPIGERIKENTKTGMYTGVIILGVGVTGALFYTILKELWSSNSPNNIYSAALDRCVNDTRIQDQLGAPIKGYGEESRRGRRQRVAHTIFERNGVPHIQMQFYIQGIRNKATVHLEMKHNSSGEYEYRYLFAKLDHYPRTTIILEDNRANDTAATSSQNNEAASF